MNSMSDANPTGRNMSRGVGPGMKAPSGYKSFQQFTPEQMKIFQQMTGMTGTDSYLSRLAGGDEEMFRQIEQPAMRQFGELQGGIASRFSGAGMGARRSSGFQNTMGQAGADFASQLQAQRQGLQRQATMDISQIAQMLMGQRPYGLYEKPQRQGTDWMGLGGAALGGLGGFMLGGPMGAAAGANMGYGIGGSVSGRGSGNIDFSGLNDILGK